MNMRILYMAVLSASVLLSSCAKEEIIKQDAIPLNIVALNADDINVLGSFPGIKGFTNEDEEAQRSMSCEEWFIFRKDDEEFRLAVTCYPYFNFDTVFAKSPVNANTGFTEGAGAAVSGIYGHMHATKTIGMNWADAEITSDFALDEYTAPFIANDLDGDGFFDITLSWDGVDYYTEDFKVEIPNINDDGLHIYRAVMKVNGPIESDYFCIYWQDDN
ncbi:MAG: hypothetical protein ACI959_002049 [Limisphaerales bacterium]|jgi:hypothetical protein